MVNSRHSVRATTLECWCRKTENVAVQLNLEGHESWPSRAVMAMNDVLLESSRKYGHSFLPWSQLKDQTLQHLQSSGVHSNWSYTF